MELLKFIAAFVWLMQSMELFNLQKRKRGRGRGRQRQRNKEEGKKKKMRKRKKTARPYPHLIFFWIITESKERK